MATLRDNLFVDNNLTPEERLALDAGQQSSLRRGYTAGRLGVESNYLAAQEASLRAAGRNAEADELRNEIGMLQARRAAFAPEVSDLRQIDGIGSLGSYVAGQVGQGVASTQDSAATALGIAAATRLGPIAKAVGQMGRPAQVATAAAPGAAAFGVNQRQMTGEFYNSAVQDPTIMATHSAQDLNQVANAYGLVGGGLDTIFPAAIARRVVGGRGLLPTTLRQQGVGTGARIGLDMLGEGATETAQQFGQQQVLGMLNPNRDTSEDGWELANAAVGGALGGGPISAVSQLAGGARERVGNVVGGKAGDEFDMATGKPKGGPNAPSSRAAKLKELFSRREVDLGEGATPGAPAAPRLSPEDRSALDEVFAELPEDMPMEETMARTAQALNRASEVAQRYLGGSQDPADQALLARLAPENDPADRVRAQMEAAERVVSRAAQDDLVRRAEAGGAGERAVRAVASAATRGLASAAKGALKVGKAAMDGVKDAATKKNLQTVEDKVQRIGDNLGAYLRGEIASVPLSQRSSKMGQHFQRLGEDLGDLIETSELNRSRGGKGAAKGRTGLPPRLMRQTIEMADDLLTAFGREGAEQRITEMQRIAGDQGGRAVFNMLSSLIENGARNINIIKARNQRELGLSLIRHMDPVQAQEAYADADLRDAIIRAVDAIARGTVTPQQRMAVVRAVGGNAQLDAMLREYNGDSEETGNPNSLWDDVADEGQYDDPDDGPDFGSDATISMADESGKPRRSKESKKTRFVGFHKKGDIAVPDVKKGVSAFEKYIGKVKDDEGRDVEKSIRPRLFEDGTTVTVDLPDGKKGQVSGIQKKMDDLVKQLGPETAVRKVDALQLMDEEGMDTPAKMALYRDYLRQDAEDNRGVWTPDRRRETLRRARAASAYVIDSIDMKVVDGKAREGKRVFRLSPQERQALEEDMTEYFARRYAVVAESVVDEAPEKFTIKDLTNLKRKAEPAVEIARKFRDTDPARMYQILDENNIITFSRKGKALNMRADDLVKWARNERRKSEASDLERNEDAKDLAPMWRDEQFVADLAMGMGAVLDSGLVDAKVVPYKTNAKGEREQFTGKKLPGSLRLATMTVAEYRKKRRELADEVLSRPPLSERDEVQTEQRRLEEVAKDLTREEPDIEPLAGTEVDPVIDPATYASMTLEERDQLRQLPSKAARDEFMANLSLRKSGERFSTQPTSSAPGNVAEDVTEITTNGVKVTRRVENGRLRLQDMPGDTIQEKQAAMERLRGSDRPSMFGDRRAAFTSPRSDDMGKTPLDFFGPDKRDLATQGYDDEFTDQRTRSRAEGFDPTRDLPRPVSPMQAKRFAELDAKKLADTLRKQPAEAFAEIESRLRSAARPKEGDERGLTGGIHYIYPVTRVLNGDELSGLDLWPAEVTRAFELRRQAARVLMKADLKPAERVRLARELATAQAAERITAQNVMTALQRMAGTPEATSPVTVKQEPAAPAAPAAQSAAPARSLPMNYKIGNVNRLRPELRGKYSADQSIAALIAGGDRTATTRSVPAGLKVGDDIKFPGVEGTYRVTGFDTVDLETASGREKWSKREGWSAEASRTFGTQVRSGATQILFERTDKPQPAAPAAPATDRAYEKEVMRRVTKEDYAGLDTKADMDKFLKTAYAMWQRGKAREAEMNRLAESQDDAEQARAEKALQLLRALDGLFAEGGAQTDLGSFYDGIADMSDADVRAMLKGAAPEVAAQAPKSSAAPGGARNVTVQDHQSSGYRDRTKFNADSADLTVAIAQDFSTAGERLTRSVAGARYVHFDFADARAAGRALAAEMKRRGATSLNVAGNGIYTLARYGMTQAQVNQYVYEMLSEANSLHPISKIVSGGQTGVDIAGAVAAQALGIPATITLPRGFVQRNVQGQDLRLSREEVAAQIERGAEALKARKLIKQAVDASAPAGAQAKTPSQEEIQRLAADVAKNGIDTTVLREFGQKYADPQAAAVADALEQMLSDDRFAGSRAAQTTVDEWSRKFAKGVKVLVRRIPEDSPLAKYIKTSMSSNPDVQLGGLYMRVNGRHTIVQVGESGDKATAIARLAHEFGHALQKIVFDEADAGTRKKLTDAYQRDLQIARSGSQDLSRFISQARVPREVREAVADTDLPRPQVEMILQVTSRAVANQPQRLMDYLTSFDEWFAEQFAKYVSSDADFALRDTPELAAFWRKATARLSRFYQSVKHLLGPNVVFAGWVESLAQTSSTRARRVDLGASGPYAAKDQAKSDQATKFIGRGSARSSTAKYAMAWGDRANSGSYTAGDVVFVSAEGNRSGRVAPDLNELDKAVQAGATIITDAPADRDRPYNVGEREVAAFLVDRGYREVAPGRWAPRKLNKQGNVTDLSKVRGDRMMARARELMESLSPEDLETLQNDVLARDPNRRKMPSALKGLFREWLREYGPFEREEMMAPERQDETERRFYEEVPEITDDPLELALAQAMLTGATLKSLNAQTGAVEGDNSQAAQAQAIAYVNKVLPGVKVAFKDITGYSGEWIEADNLIVVARQSAPGAMQTTYHEAMHAFFSKFLKNNPEAMRVMRSLAENQKVMDRVVALLAKYPAARQQLVDGEERLAYIYQFWAAGLLELPQGRPATIMQKVRKFLRRAAGMITDTERAVEILEAFHSGELAKPSYAGRVMADIINQGTMTTKARRKFDKQLQAVYAAVVPAETVLATSASKTARKLAKQFFTNPGDDESAGLEPGYLNARRVVASQYSNRFARIVDGMTKADMEEITKLLQQKVKPEDIAYVPHRRAVERIRDLLGNFYEYMSDGRGLPVADAGRDYFPTVWDFDKLVEKKREFIDLVTNKYKRDGEELWNHMVGATSKAQAQQDVTHVGGVLNPFFAGKEKIELPWFEAADREKFLQKDLVEIMTTYFHRGARAAEYHYRFGEDGINLQKDLERVQSELMEEARKQLKDGKFDDAQQAEAWAQRQYKQVINATAAMEGSLGKDTDEKWRKVTSWITAYQNVRLLPLTLFASFVDPLNMVARGATMKEAYETFLRGMTEVFRNWRNMMRSEPVPTKMDKWTQLAEDIGAVDSLMFSEFVSEQYSSGYMAPGAKRLNDWFFRINGMEAWNRGMRSGAVRSAVRFIERHTKTPETHSARWLKELGLTPADVKLDADGELITSVKGLQAAGLSPTQARAAATKIHQAINRWVEGAVLTPNAAQRPSWASDPRWSFMFHLKQFSYSFHQTILKRGIKEMNYGNMAPLGSFLWYVPTMIAADIFKGLIQGGGELPPSMQGLTAGDWVMRGIERAGFLGIPGIAFEGTSDPASLMGPTVDQVFDAITDPADKTVLRSLPAMPLYSNWVQ